MESTKKAEFDKTADGKSRGTMCASGEAASANFLWKWWSCDMVWWFVKIWGEGVADTTSNTFDHHTAKTTAEPAVTRSLEHCKELPGISTLWCTFMWIMYYLGAISYSICSINQEIARIFPAGFSCMATSITWLCFFGSFHSAHNERMLVR